MNVHKHILMFDVDDTVCESTKPISEAVARVLNSLREKNFLLVFTSGSKIDQVYHQLHPILKGKYWIMGASGSSCESVDSGGRKLIFSEEMPQEDRTKILNLLSEVVEKFNIQTMTTKEDQIQDRISQITLSCIGRGAPSDIKSSFDADRSKRKVWVDYIKERLGGEYNINIGGTTSIDITLKGVDKSTGAKKWLECMNFDKRDIMFFGDQLEDGGNDSVMKDLVDCIQVGNPMDTLNILEYMDMLFYRREHEGGSNLEV